MSNWPRKYSKTASTSELPSKQAPEVCLSPGSDVAEWVKTHLDIEPDAIQTKFLNAPEKDLLLLCSRQWGKSTMAAAKALHHALTRKNAFILVASPSYRQSREIARKTKEFAKKIGIKAVREDGGFTLANGVRVLPLPEAPDTTRCYSAVTLLIIDEAAFISDGMIDAITPPLATTNGSLWLLSTAGEQKGYFYKTWMARPKGWGLFRATIEDFNRISPEFLLRERINKGENVFRREYFCEFHSGRTQFVDESLIEAIFDTDFPLLGE